MEEYDITDSTVRLVYQPLRGLVNATDAHKHNSVMCGFDPLRSRGSGFHHWLQIGSWLYPCKNICWAFNLHKDRCVLDFIFKIKTPTRIPNN